MNLFGLSKKVKDERITQMQNKIYREMYILVTIICGLSIAVKSFLYGINTETVATELVILFTQGVYYVIRSSGLGIFSAETELHDQHHKTTRARKNVIGGVVFGLAMAIFFGTRSAVVYAETYGTAVSYFVITFLASVMIYIPFFLIFFSGSFAVANSRSERVNEKALNDDENGDLDEKY